MMMTMMLSMLQQQKSGDAANHRAFLLFERHWSVHGSHGALSSCCHAKMQSTVSESEQCALTMMMTKMSEKGEVMFSIYRTRLFVFCFVYQLLDIGEIALKLL